MKTKITLLLIAMLLATSCATVKQNKTYAFKVKVSFNDGSEAVIFKRYISKTGKAPALKLCANTGCLIVSEGKYTSQTIACSVKYFQRYVNIPSLSNNRVYKNALKSRL